MGKDKTVDTGRELLNDDEFRRRHRKESRFFTRNRVLTFGIVAMLILQKSMKSIQLILNEFTSFFDLKPVIVLPGLFNSQVDFLKNISYKDEKLNSVRKEL